MHPFRYIGARTVNEVVRALSEYGPRARCLAGGTDILVQVRGGRFALDALVDVKDVPELATYHLNNGLHLGAAVPFYQLYEDEGVRQMYPALVDAARIIGGIQIQSRASLGGNLCNASPSADGVCPLIVHEATAVVAGPRDIRETPVESFATGPGRTVLEPGEFLMALRLPQPPARFGAAYERFIPRNEMDIAVAGVASAVVLDPRGENVEWARIALAAVGPTPIHAQDAGDFLAGKAATSESVHAAAQLASQAAKPITDMRGTEHQRRHLVGVLARRTLGRAIERARQTIHQS